MSKSGLRLQDKCALFNLSIYLLEALAHLFQGLPDSIFIFHKSQTQIAVAFFAKSGGGLRPIALSRLPSHETVYAMTVHKSQGSEFDRTVVVLPQRPSPVLSRELFYTAVTRARRELIVFASETMIRTAIASRAERSSGLVHLLT